MAPEGELLKGKYHHRMISLFSTPHCGRFKNYQRLLSLNMVRLHYCHIVRTSKLLSKLEVLHLLSPLNVAWTVLCWMNQKSIFLWELYINASPNTLCFQNLYIMMQLITISWRHQLMTSQSGTTCFQSFTNVQNEVISTKNYTISNRKFFNHIA